MKRKDRLMESRHNHRLPIIFLLLSLSLFALCGCSSDAVSTSDDPAEITVAAIEVVATPDSINPNETTTVEATAYDASGNIISGIDIAFSLDKPTLAFVTGTATTDSTGVAQVYLTARDKSGEVNVTATAVDAAVASETPAIVSIQEGAAPAQILLSLTPASIIFEGTTTVRAQVLDAHGDPVSDGTSVSFTANNTEFGDFTAATSTTTNGFATSTFRAANKQGSVRLTIKCVSITAATNLTINPAETATIEFVSATPQRIALQGSGTTDFPDYSLLSYVVKDSNGNVVNGESVSFTLSSFNGGAYLGATQGSTDAAGIVEVTLHSGMVAGPVTVTATVMVDALEISSQSSQISMGGGVPSAKRFSVAATILNLPGLEETNVETEISAFLADRFGNYNVLVGTTVSFVTEQGLGIDTSDVTVDEDGIATVVARTQAPSGASTAAENVAAEPWETSLVSYISQTYRASLPGHPRDGLVSVLAYVKGEEHFYDANANGVYNTGESFVDTYADPFIDIDDDGIRDASSPFEEYIDTAVNGVWNGLNGSWDSDKQIFTNFKILLTGQPYIVASNITTFSIANGGSTGLKIIVCDRNGNYLTPGSTVSISTDKGKLTGATSFTFPDTNGLGPLELGVTLSDSNADEEKAETANISISVTWKGAYSTQTISGVVASGTVR